MIEHLIYYVQIKFANDTFDINTEAVSEVMTVKLEINELIA